MQEDTLYRHILRDAWRVTRKNKTLWLLGFLAVFWGDIGAYQSLNQVIGQPVYDASSRGGISLATFSEFLTFGGFVTLMFITLILLAFIFALIVLVTAGRGGLLYLLSERAEIDKKATSATVREGLRRGMEKFWPLLGIGIITRLDLPLYVLWFKKFGAILDLPGAFSIIFTSGFVLLTILSLILSFLGIYASLLVISENRRFGAAVLGSFALFVKNWLVSIELALILYLITMGVGIALVIGLFIIAVPFVFLGVLLSLLNTAPIIIWLVISPAILLAVALLLAAGAAFVTFQYSAWVLLFARIRSERAVAKMMRVTARFGRLLHRKLV